LKELKEGHQGHLLNTKYLCSHILLVSKEDFERIKDMHKSIFKTKKRRS